MTDAEMTQFFGLTTPCTPGVRVNLQAYCRDGTGYTFGGEDVAELPGHMGAKKAGGCGGCKDTAAKLALIEKWQVAWGAESLLELARILFPKSPH